MHYCSIPDHITNRANEIEDFKKNLQNIQIDFFDFKIDYAKSSSLSIQSKIEIKKLIDQDDYYELLKTKKIQQLKRWPASAEYYKKY